MLPSCSSKRLFARTWRKPASAPGNRRMGITLREDCRLQQTRPLSLQKLHSSFSITGSQGSLSFLPAPLSAPVVSQGAEGIACSSFKPSELTARKSLMSTKDPHQGEDLVCLPPPASTSGLTLRTSRAGAGQSLFLRFLHSVFFFSTYSDKTEIVVWMKFGGTFYF